MGVLTMHDLFNHKRRPRVHSSGLGQGESTCGPKPNLAAGERATCCPGVGWVVFDMAESEIGICTRAKGDDQDQTASVSTAASPLERVAQLRRELERRRELLEEEQHQRAIQELQLRSTLTKIQSVQEQESARVAAQERAEIARLKIDSERRSSEETKKLLTYGAIALVAGKALKIF